MCESISFLSYNSVLFLHWEPRSPTASCAFKIQGAKKSRGWVTAGKLNNDVYLRRLMAEELFLGSLKNLFFNDQIVMAVQERIEDFDSAATQETAMRFSESPARRVVVSL